MAFERNGLALIACLGFCVAASSVFTVSIADTELNREVSPPNVVAALHLKKRPGMQIEKKEEMKKVDRLLYL